MFDFGICKNRYTQKLISRKLIAAKIDLVKVSVWARPTQNFQKSIKKSEYCKHIFKKIIPNICIVICYV